MDRPADSSKGHVVQVMSIIRDFSFGDKSVGDEIKWYR
jgi:hypothetical protein